MDIENEGEKERGEINKEMFLLQPLRSEIGEYREDIMEEDDALGKLASPFRLVVYILHFSIFFNVTACFVNTEVTIQK